LTRKDPGIPDPRLTELGRAQAHEAGQKLRGQRIDRIIASPYTRALETASIVAAEIGAPILVNPVVRERYAFACDIGSPTTELAAAWPELDFAHVPEVWWPPIEEPADSVLARAATFRAEMAALPGWQNTLVVSHWGFILSFTGIKVQNGEILRTDPTTPAPAEINWKHG
ncbi:MAG: histidine phosphatase family protein, partial [Alphaproteobacteria bacterium]|nr:histidine phosphatase family protein [Alphaproteobacteria bacterium]